MLVFSTASTKTLGLVLLLVLVLYSVQLWTPLRLTGDSIELLSIALSATNGNGFLNHGHNSHYFPGYPAMVVCLNKMHLGNAWSLVGLNEIFLLLGLLAAYYAIRTYFAFPVEWALAILLLTGLSFSLIKHFTLALTDVPFVGVSLMALAFVVAAEKQVGYWYHLLWGVALGLSVGALLIRPVAVALLVCLSWSFCAHIGVWRFLKTHRRWLIASCLVTSAGLWVAAAVLFRTKYVHEAIAIFSAGNVIRPISRILLFRVHEVGELSLNLPSSKLGPLQPVAWIIGAVVVTLVLRYLRPSRLGSVEVYLAAYVGILCVWPYGDTRFWIPVLPLLFAEIFWLTQPWTWSGWRRTFVNWYAVGYFLAGLLALAYSTWLTFSAGAFPDRFGDSHLRPTYRAFYGYPNIDQSQIDQAALELLRRYSPRRHETIP